MKNSFIFLIFFFVIANCSSKKNELLVDIESFKKQGVEINTSIKKDLQKEIKIISRFSNYQSFDLKDWMHENFQNSNFIPHTRYTGSFNTKKTNKFFSSIKKNDYDKNILSFEDKLYYVDDVSNIYSIDLNLNFIKKFTIYKKKYFQDYLLKFSIASDGINLFIADNLGNLHAYNPKLNKIIWTNKLGVPFVSNLIFYKKNLYIVNDNGKIYSFDSNTGNQNWSYESATNIIKNNNAFQVVADLDKLIFSNDLGDIYCIDLIEKNLIWSINTEASDNNLSNSNELLQYSKIIIKDKDVFLSTNKNKLFNVKADTGLINWVIDLPSPSTITSLVTNTNLINVTNDGYILIINKVDGVILYKIKILSYFKNLIKDEKEFIFKYSFISSNNLYVVSKNGFIFTINTNNLSNISYKKISKNIASFPIVVSNNIYFLDYKGMIYRLN